MFPITTEDNLDWPDELYVSRQWLKPCYSESYIQAMLLRYEANWERYKVIISRNHELGFEVLTPDGAITWHQCRSGWNSTLTQAELEQDIPPVNPFANDILDGEPFTYILQLNVMEPSYFPSSQLFRPHVTYTFETEVDGEGNSSTTPHAHIHTSPTDHTFRGDWNAEAKNLLVRMMISNDRALSTDKYTRLGGHGGRPRKTPSP